MLSLLVLLASAPLSPLCDLEARLLGVPAEDADAVHAAWLVDADVAVLRSHRSDPCAAELGTLLIKVTTDHHRAAQRHRRITDYELAAEFYERVLALPIPPDERHRIAFFRAELLFDLGRWTAAMNAYRDVVKERRDGEFAITSGYSRILSAQNIVNCKPATGGLVAPGWDWRVTVPAATTKCERAGVGEKLSIAELDLVLADEAFLALTEGRALDRRQQDEVLHTLFEAATLHSQHGRRDAVSLYRQVLARFPETELAARSAGELLDLLWRIDRNEACIVAEEIAQHPDWLKAWPPTAAAVAAVRAQSQP